MFSNGRLHRWPATGRLYAEQPIEQHLTNIANSMSDLTTALGDMLQELVDLAIVAAIEAAVASADPEPITKVAAIAALALSVVRIGLVVNRM